MAHSRHGVFIISLGMAFLSPRFWLKYFLGIEVGHSRQGIFISQHVTDLLKETGKTACKSASIPIDPKLRLGKVEEDVAVDKEMYQRLVGRLIYLSHTRLDIAYVVSVISQFMHSPKVVHLQAAHSYSISKGHQGKVFYSKGMEV